MGQGPPGFVPGGLSPHGIQDLGVGFGAGLSSGVLPFFPAKYVFVNSAGQLAGTSTGAGRGETAVKPFVSIAAALAAITSNRGDIMVVAPGHVETVNDATTLVISKTGFSIEGLGSGSRRPEIKVGGATSAKVTISGANVRVHNVRITGNIDAIVEVLRISGDGVHLLDVEYQDVTGECVLWAMITGDDVRIQGLKYRGAAEAGTVAAIKLNAANRFELSHFDIDGNFSASAIECVTTPSEDIKIHSGWARTRNSADLILKDTITGSTGTIGPNLFLRLQDDAANITEALTGATFVYHQKISVVNSAGEIGMEINITASTDD